MLIDYELLGQASFFYMNRGYSQIEVPWMVNLETSSITCPDIERVFLLKSEKPTALIGSAEQGFLQIYDQLTANKAYFSISPCFRNEPEVDRTHQKVFMKLELFAKEANMVNRFIEDALDFYRIHNLVDPRPHLISTGPNQFDIELNGVELGSYSYIEKDSMRWSCGTGLALPRFEIANVLACKPQWAGAEYDDDIWEILKSQDD